MQLLSAVREEEVVGIFVGEGMRHSAGRGGGGEKCRRWEEERLMWTLQCDEDQTEEESREDTLTHGCKGMEYSICRFMLVLLQLLL